MKKKEKKKYNLYINIINYNILKFSIFINMKIYFL